jgi:hypothetical protein
MRLPILRTEDYLLIVNSDEIEDNDFFLVESGVGYPINSINKAILNNDGTKNFHSDHCKKILAYLPLNDAVPTLDNVPLLPEPQEWTYTENDIIRAFETDHWYKVDGTYQENFNRFIKELKQTKYPTHFFLDMEMNMNGKNGLDRARLIPITMTYENNNVVVIGRYVN